MIEVTQLCMQQGAFTLSDVSFTVPAGAYGMLMGPTGCGKTTILEAVCGLRRVEAGGVYLHGDDITHAKPGERNIGYVPQDGALFPTMNIFDHLAFSLRLRRWIKADIEHRVEELAEVLRISHLLDRRPVGLSGGERQRVARGRALAFRPRVLCLDEPLSALDDDTKDRMIDLLKRVQQHERITALHITHSRDEARRLGSMVLRVNHGVVEPVDLHEDEANEPQKANELDDERETESAIA